MNNTKPFLPVATFEQVLNYRPELAETHTASPLVNAVAAALYETKYIEACDIARYLAVDRQKLTNALSLELGMPLIDLIHQYRLIQIHKAVLANPDQPLDEIAHACGYASAGSLWRFVQRKTGKTVHGEKSQAGPEWYDEMRKRLRGK